MSLQLNKTKLIGKWTIAAAAIQGATTGHAYWIDATGALIDAGASIAAANPTNQPPINFDVSQYSDLQWSLFYGAQTSNVGGKIGIAELWPESPVGVVGTIPPYVRDVASHWLVTAGLGFVLQARLPEDVSEILNVTSQTNTLLVTDLLDTADFAALYLQFLTTQITQITVSEVDAAGNLRTIVAPSSTAGSPGFIGVGLGSRSYVSGAEAAYIQLSVPPRLRFSAAQVAASTSLFRLIGTRKTPIRRPARIAPYIQWVAPTGGAAPVVPTAGSQPIYLQLWGRIADGEVR